jgi:2'-5' RNA ligase
MRRFPMAGVVTTNLNHKVFDEMRNLISKKDITPNPPEWAPGGIEDHSHLTIFYGIPEEMQVSIPEWNEKYKNFFNKIQPTNFTVTLVSLFEHGDLYDVIIVTDVSTANKALKKLNQRFRSAFSLNPPTFNTYVPHITIGYVKPGLGKKYVKRFNTKYEIFFSKRPSFPIEEVTITDDQDNKVKFKLNLLNENQVKA